MGCISGSKTRQNNNNSQQLVQVFYQPIQIVEDDSKNLDQKIDEAIEELLEAMDDFDKALQNVNKNLINK